MGLCPSKREISGRIDGAGKRMLPTPSHAADRRLQIPGKTSEAPPFREVTCPVILAPLAEKLAILAMFMFGLGCSTRPALDGIGHRDLPRRRWTESASCALNIMESLRAFLSRPSRLYSTDPGEPVLGYSSSLTILNRSSFPCPP
jgi:hypothetical protein